MMAKLSVYVPDELMAEARRAGDLNVSQLLQMALRERLGGRGAKPYARLSESLEAERERIQEAVVARVAEAYQVGYGVGLNFALDLPWEAFEDLAVQGWNLREWWRTFDEHDYRWLRADAEDIAAGVVALDRDEALSQAIDIHGDPIPLDESRTPIGVPAEGFVDAIRDVWQGARADHRTGSGVAPDMTSNQADAEVRS